MSDSSLLNKFPDNDYSYFPGISWLYLIPQNIRGTLDWFLPWDLLY